MGKQVVSTGQAKVDIRGIEQPIAKRCPGFSPSEAPRKQVADEIAVKNHMC